MSDPYIKEAAALMEQAKGALSGGVDKVKGMTENVDVQKLLPYLLAGGAGAVGGVALTGRRKERNGETRGQYLTRILRNAVAAGALTGAGSYAAVKGFQNTVGKADLEHPLTGKADDQGPVASAARRASFGYPAAALVGVGGLAATAGMKNPVLGANPGKEEAGKIFIEALKNKHTGLGPGQDSMEGLKGLSKTAPAELQYLLGNPNTQDGKGLRALAQEAGINPHDPNAGKLSRKGTKSVMKKTPDSLRPLLKTLLRHAPPPNKHTIHEMGKLPSMLLGRTTGRRIGRGALGTAFALTPAVIGSLLSSSPE